jgi:hypothetical protein
MTHSEKTSALNAWHRADLMLKHCAQSEFIFMPIEKIFSQPSFSYLLLFHALLFTVIKFLKEEDSIPPSIVSEVEAHWNNLRLFRNAVFHIQKEFVSPKTMALVHSGLDTKTTFRIHYEIGQFLENLSPTD